MEYTVDFETAIRGECVKVEAAAYGDEEGVYKTEIRGIWLEGVNVAGILDDATLAEIDGMIEDECWKDWSNR